MKKTIWCCALLMTSLIGYTQTTIELNPEKDNSIFSESDNSNGEGKLYAGKTCTDFTRRALLEFDIASMVPFGATITAVNLTLNMDNVSPGAGTQDYSLHRVGIEWGEGTSMGDGEGSEAVAPDATWADAMFETVDWDDAGGDFNPDASAIIGISDVLGDFSWASPGMIDNVQDWLDYPGSNHGWILIGTEGDGIDCNARRFGSKDEGIAPILEITYICDAGAPVAICQSLILYLDAFGEATITGEDLDGGSEDVCEGVLTFDISITDFDCDDIIEVVPGPNMIISGVFDCPLPGGTPKGVEVYIINDIDDMSAYGIGFANNGGGTDGEEFTFPAEAASAGSHLFVALEDIRFAQWFGFDPDYTDGAAAINGDDAIELFFEDEVIDIFGDIDVDGSGQPWEYLDGWAYRVSDTELDGAVFDISHWTFSGPNELDGESRNATAVTPFPLKQYMTDPTVGIVVEMTVIDEDANESTCTTSIMVFDTLAPTMACVGALTVVLDETGMVVLDASDIDASTEDGCGIDEMSISMTTFTCENDGDNDVWLYATDIYGNADSCMVVVTIDASEVISISEVLTDPTCFGLEDGSIDITVAGGTPAYTFDWDNDGEGDFDDLEDLALIGDGEYVIVVKDENGCTATASFAIEDPEEIEATTEVEDASCPSTADGSIIILTVTGGTGPYTGDEDMTDLLPGTYTITITDANGCFIDVEVEVGSETVVDVGVTVDEGLTADQDGGTYQWVSCPDYTPISEATDQTFNPSFEDGDSFAVIVTLGGCTDTSECVDYIFESIDEYARFNARIYPNPSNGKVYIEFSDLDRVNLVLTDLRGSVVLEKTNIQSQDWIDLSALENGVYFVQLRTESGTITKKLILNQ